LKYLPHAFSPLATQKYGFLTEFLLQQSLSSDLGTKSWANSQLSREFGASGIWSSGVPTETNNVSPEHQTHEKSNKGRD
jgi:hypothetical protein